jgi:GNAT superfamily N-acetyltransferase
MSAVLEVRDARPEDAAAVAGVHVRSWQAAYRGLLPDSYLDGLRAEDRAARYTFDLIGPAHPATSVALATGRVCGFVTMGAAGGDAGASTGEIHALYVDPGAWGQGVGRLLLKRARSRLAEQGSRTRSCGFWRAMRGPSASTGPMAGSPTGSDEQPASGGSGSMRSATGGCSAAAPSDPRRTVKALLPLDHRREVHSRVNAADEVIRTGGRERALEAVVLHLHRGREAQGNSTSFPWL